MKSETSVSFELGSKDRENYESCSLVEDLLKKLRLSTKIINETDEYTEELFGMLTSGREDGFIDFIQHLVWHQDNDFPKLNCSDRAETYLGYACRHGLHKVAKYLIDSGADLSAVCFELAHPPLYTAIVCHNFVIAKYIIEYDEKQLFMHYNNYNILHEITHTSMKCSDDGLEFLKYLLKEINWLYLRGNIKEAQYLLNEEDFEGKTPLKIAVENGFERMIIVFLENGVYMFRKDKSGECGFLNMNPNIVEEYFNRKVTKGFIEKHNKIGFDYTSIVPPECFVYDNNSEETSRIMYLSQFPDFRHLINHPVVSTFIHLKWQKVKWLFYLNLLIYVIFCCLFTLHILLHTESQSGYSDKIVEKGLVVCLTILISRELLQAFMSPLGYLRQRDNWIEIALVVSTLLTMFSNNSIHQQISAVAIFLTWTELIILIGRHPNLSTVVEMYKKVSLNFFKYLPCYSIFVIAFALSFYILSRESNPEDAPVIEILSNVTTTMVDTLVRFVKLNPDTLPINGHPVIVRVFLLMFVLLIVIILLNLLNGLAVSDTQSIIYEAEMLALISRLKFISSVENMTLILRRQLMCRIKVFYRPKVNVKGSGELFVCGDDMVPDVLKAARQIKRVCSRGKSENKLDNLLTRVENINKSVNENMIVLDNQISNINKNMIQIDKQIKYLSKTLQNLQNRIDLAE